MEMNLFFFDLLPKLFKILCMSLCLIDLHAYSGGDVLEEMDLAALLEGILYPRLFEQDD